MASDLLVTTAPGKKKPPLKIRQDPKKGFYGELRTFKVSWFTSKNSLLYFTVSADGLKEVLVNNYDEINARMEEGTVIQNSKEIRHTMSNVLHQWKFWSIELNQISKVFNHITWTIYLHELKFDNRL